MKWNIGVFGKMRDFHVAFVVDKLHAKHCDVSVFEYNSDQSSDTRSRLRFELDNNIACYLDNVNIDQFDAFWFWPKLEYPRFGDDEAFINSYIAGSEWNSILRNLQEFYRDRVVNNDTAYHKSSYKLEQLKVAKALGMEIPATLVSNDGLEIKKFCAKYHHVIIKMIGPPQIPVIRDKRIYETAILTNRISKADIDELEPYASIESSYIQEEIAKDYELRISVVGQDLFAFKIDSQSKDYTEVDWRYGSGVLGFDPYKIPKGLESKIHDHMSHFGLVYGVFDFIKRKGSNYVFLECNPQGSWCSLDLCD